MPSTSPKRRAASPAATFARVRTRCLSFPDATERESHGSPTFFVRDKRSFLNIVESYYGPNGRPAIICAAPDGMQSALVEAKPDLYFLPKYVAKLGWIGMWLDAGAPWGEIEAVVDAAYATAAEKVPPARARRGGTRSKAKRPAKKTKKKR